MLSFANKDHVAKIKSIEELLDFLIENEDAIVILPTEKWSRKLEKDYLKQLKKPVNKIPIFSINSFTQYLFNSNNENLSLLKDFQKIEIIKRIIKNNNFTFYQSEKISYKNIYQIQEIINGLRNDGIDSNTLLFEANDLNTDNYVIHDKKRFIDIYKILCEYENYLGDEYVDYYFILNYLINSNLSNTLGYKKIILWGFSDFKEPEYNFIKALTKIFDVQLFFDFNIISGPYFLNFENIFKRLINLKLRSSDKIDFNKFYDSSEKENFKIFKERSIIVEGFADINEETFGICKLVDWLINEVNIPPKNICIASRRPSDYSNLMREFFADNNIPYNISDRITLDKTKVIASIFVLFDLINFDYSLNDLKRLGNSKFININFDIDLIKKIASKVKYNGGDFSGLEGWLIIAERMKNIINMNQNNKDVYNTFVNNINIIKKNIILEKNKLATAKQHWDSIKKQLKKLNIEENIVSLKNTLEKLSFKNEKNILIESLELNSTAIRVFYETMEELCTFMDELNNNKKIKFKSFIESIKPVISGTKVQIREKYNYGVTITSIEQTRGFNFDVIILTGLIENKFPLPYKTDVYLGKELKDSENKHYQNEVFQFYEFLKKSNNNTDIYLTYPKSDNDKENIKSHFLEFLNLENSDSNVASSRPWYNRITNTREIKLLESKYSDKWDEEERFNLKLEENKLSENSKSRINTVFDGNYSPSMLDNIYDYPYSFFYFNLLNIRMPEDVDKYLTPLDLGNSFHAIIKLFFNKFELNQEFQDINNFKVPVIQLKTKEKDYYINLFKEIAKEYFDNYLIHNKLGEIEFSLLVENNESKNGLFVNKFAKILDDILNRNLLIFSFEKHYKTTYSVDGKSINFQGKIDRIDLQLEEGVNSFEIVDYKLTLSDKYEKIDKSFQLPIYYQLLLDDISRNITDFNIRKVTFESIKSKKISNKNSIIDKYEFYLVDNIKIKKAIEEKLLIALEIKENLLNLNFNFDSKKYTNEKNNAELIKLIL